MLICIVGKTCAGKDTLLRKLVYSYEFKKLVGYTTRPMRNNEVNGIHYWFMTTGNYEDDYEYKCIARDYEVANGETWSYWLDKRDIEHAVNSDEKYACILDAKGAIELKEMYKDVQIFFIDVPISIRLYRYFHREQKEKNPNFEEVIRRILDDEKEFECIFNMKQKKVIKAKKSPKQIAQVISDICNKTKIS